MTPGLDAAKVLRVGKPVTRRCSGSQQWRGQKPMKPSNMFKRAISGVALVSVGVMALGVLPAAAAATLGQAVTDGLACASGGFSGVQAETAKGVPSYIVPGGVTQITSWSTQAGADGGSM